MQKWYARTEMLFGRDAIETLAKARVAVFGVGGVGGYAVEVMARSGVGHITLIDNDTVSITNLNRQIIALIRILFCRHYKLLLIHISEFKIISFCKKFIKLIS